MNSTKSPKESSPVSVVTVSSEVQASAWIPSHIEPAPNSPPKVELREKEAMQIMLSQSRKFMDTTGHILGPQRRGNGVIFVYGKDGRKLTESEKKWVRPISYEYCVCFARQYISLFYTSDFNQKKTYLFCTSDFNQKKTLCLCAK